MVEHLGDAELVLGLVEELLVVGAVDGDDLEGVVLAVGGAADVQGSCCGRPSPACRPPVNLPICNSLMTLMSASGESPMGAMIPRRTAADKAEAKHWASVGP